MIQPTTRMPMFRFLIVRRWADAVNPHRFGDVLDFVLANEINRSFYLAFDEIVRRPGQRNTAGICQAFEPRGNIYAIAVDRSVILFDDVPEIDTDAEPHAPLL